MLLLGNYLLPLLSKLSENRLHLSKSKEDGEKTTNSVKYHHYAIVQLQKNVYLCRQNSTK